MRSSSRPAILPLVLAFACLASCAFSFSVGEEPSLPLSEGHGQSGGSFLAAGSNHRSNSFWSTGRENDPDENRSNHNRAFDSSSSFLDDDQESMKQYLDAKDRSGSFYDSRNFIDDDGNAGRYRDNAKTNRRRKDVYKNRKEDSLSNGFFSGSLSGNGNSGVGMDNARRNGGGWRPRDNGDISNDIDRDLNGGRDVIKRKGGGKAFPERRFRNYDRSRSNRPQASYNRRNLEESSRSGYRRRDMDYDYNPYDQGFGEEQIYYYYYDPDVDSLSLGFNSHNRHHNPGNQISDDALMYEHGLRNNDDPRVDSSKKTTQIETADDEFPIKENEAKNGIGILTTIVSSSKVKTTTTKAPITSKEVKDQSANNRKDKEFIKAKKEYPSSSTTLTTASNINTPALTRDPTEIVNDEEERIKELFVNQVGDYQSLKPDIIPYRGSVAQLDTNTTKSELNSSHVALEQTNKSGKPIENNSSNVVLDRTNKSGNPIENSETKRRLIDVIMNTTSDSVHPILDKENARELYEHDTDTPINEGLPDSSLNDSTSISTIKQGAEELMSTASSIFNMSSTDEMNILEPMHLPVQKQTESASSEQMFTIPTKTAQSEESIKNTSSSYDSADEENNMLEDHYATPTYPKENVTNPVEERENNDYHVTPKNNVRGEIYDINIPASASELPKNQNEESKGISEDLNNTANEERSKNRLSIGLLSTTQDVKEDNENDFLNDILMMPSSILKNPTIPPVENDTTARTSVRVQKEFMSDSSMKANTKIQNSLSDEKSSSSLNVTAIVEPETEAQDKIQLKPINISNSSNTLTENIYYYPAYPERSPLNAIDTLSPVSVEDIMAQSNAASVTPHNETVYQKASHRFANTSIDSSVTPLQQEINLEEGKQNVAHKTDNLTTNALTNPSQINRTITNYKTRHVSSDGTQSPHRVQGTQSPDSPADEVPTEGQHNDIVGIPTPKAGGPRNDIFGIPSSETEGPHNDIVGLPAPKTDIQRNDTVSNPTPKAEGQRNDIVSIPSSKTDSQRHNNASKQELLQQQSTHLSTERGNYSDRLEKTNSNSTIEASLLNTTVQKRSQNLNAAATNNFNKGSSAFYHYDTNATVALKGNTAKSDQIQRVNSNSTTDSERKDKEMQQLTENTDVRELDINDSVTQQIRHLTSSEPFLFVDSENEKDFQSANLTDTLPVDQMINETRDDDVGNGLHLADNQNEDINNIQPTPKLGYDIEKNSQDTLEHNNKSYVHIQIIHGDNLGEHVSNKSDDNSDVNESVAVKTIDPNPSVPGEMSLSMSSKSREKKVLSAAASVDRLGVAKERSLHAGNDLIAEEGKFRNKGILDTETHRATDPINISKDTGMTEFNTTTINTPLQQVSELVDVRRTFETNASETDISYQNVVILTEQESEQYLNERTTLKPTTDQREPTDLKVILSSSPLKTNTNLDLAVPKSTLPSPNETSLTTQNSQTGSHQTTDTNLKTLSSLSFKDNSLTTLNVSGKHGLRTLSTSGSYKQNNSRSSPVSNTTRTMTTMSSSTFDPSKVSTETLPREDPDDVSESILANSGDNVTDSISENGGNVSESIPENGGDVSESIPENGGDVVVENILADGGEDVSESISANGGDDVADIIPANGGDDVSDSISANDGDDVSEKVHANDGDDVSEKVHANGGDDVSEKVLANGGDDVSDSIPENGDDDVSDSIPENGGDDVSDSIPEHGGDDVSDSIPENGGDDVSDSIPEHGGLLSTMGAAFNDSDYVEIEIPETSAYMVQDFSLRRTNHAKPEPGLMVAEPLQEPLQGSHNNTTTPSGCAQADPSALCPAVPAPPPSSARAAMSAVLTSHFGPTKEQIIPFDLELLDLADNYDNTTGMFICTIPGTYVISLYLMSHPGAKVNARVFINNRPIAALWADDSQNAGFYPSSSIQTIVQLGFGDQAYVMLVDGGYGDSWVHANYNVFTIFLLYKQVFK